MVKYRADVGDCRLIAGPAQQGIDCTQGHLRGKTRFLSDKITGCPNESCGLDIRCSGALQRDVQEARTAGGGEPLSGVPVALDQVAKNLPGVAAGIACNDILVGRQIGRAQAGMRPIAPVCLVRTPRGDEDTFAEGVDAPIIVWRQATVPTRLGIGDRLVGFLLAGQGLGGKVMEAPHAMSHQRQDLHEILIAPRLQQGRQADIRADDTAAKPTVGPNSSQQRQEVINVVVAQCRMNRDLSPTRLDLPKVLHAVIEDRLIEPLQPLRAQLLIRGRGDEKRDEFVDSLVDRRPEHAG